MGKTYSCDVDGCDMVFLRDFELRKHKVKHEDSNRLSYCEWPECDFYTLDPRRLDVHFAIHTGEQIHDCPDKIQVLGPSGLLEREEPCKYRTNDPSLLTKHRKRAHGYIPQLRASSKNTGTFAFVFWKSSLAATSDATSRPRKTKRVRKPKTTEQRSKPTQVRAGDKIKYPAGHGEDTTLDDCLPSTPQQGADKYEQPNVESSDATGPSSQAAGFTNTTPEYMASNAHGLAHPEPLDMGGSNNPTLVAPISWNTHEPWADVELPHASIPANGNTTPVALFQGDVPFDPATDFHWSTFYMEGFASPSTAGMYNPAPYNHDPYNSERNSEMNTISAMGSFEGWGSLEHYNFDMA